MNNRQRKKNVLKINEIFYSIQGESTFAGQPCVFIRLTYCNLRCSYCDTEYAFYEGDDYTIDEIVQKVAGYACPLVEITGGEPLIQDSVYPLLSRLADLGYTVLLETGGHMDIGKVDKRIRRIMDIKCPSSGESDKVRWENISLLSQEDEVKFVIGNREDYDWARDVLEKYQLVKRCPVLLAPVFGKIENQILAEWILEDKLPVRFQLQLHKYIWEHNKKGV
ncbi:MAG TPA: radical SAM protein [Calditrichaeota bacterium]|nr:radical SAM protein [Calditrichota bacterium]